MGANTDLDQLEAVNIKALELQSQQKELQKNIREGFIYKTVVFIDMVGSTLFKKTYIDNPEIWILRNKQFSDLLSNVIEQFNGLVVKYIGDEVMATFSNTNDAQNLILRISEIEESLKTATGYETRIKTAIDYGLVYELNFKGHDIPDPHSSIVDRCARISKFAKAGEVVSSASFVEKTASLNWKKVGKTNLKGLGLETIYQLGKSDISIEEVIEIEKEELERLKDEIEDLKISNSQLKESYTDIKDQLKKSDVELTNDIEDIDILDDEQWSMIEEKIKELHKIIYGAPGNYEDYARFLFLYYSKSMGDTYNKYEGRAFDSLIESGLVERNDSHYYELNTSNRRNDKALNKIIEIEKLIDSYLLDYDQNEDDLFDWTMKDSEFWNKYVDIRVV